MVWECIVVENGSEGLEIYSKKFIGGFAVLHKLLRLWSLSEESLVSGTMLVRSQL